MTAYELGGFLGGFLITGLIRYAYIRWYRKNKKDFDPVMPNVLSLGTCIILYGIINAYKFSLPLSFFVGLIKYFLPQLCWLVIDYIRTHKLKVKQIAIVVLSAICFYCVKTGVVVYVSKNIVPDIVNKSVLSCWALASENFCKDSGYIPEKYIRMLNTMNKINDLKYSAFKTVSHVMEQSCIETTTMQYYDQLQSMTKPEICYNMDFVTIYDVQYSQQAVFSIFPPSAMKKLAKELITRN